MTWSAADEADLIRRKEAGETNAECARALGRKFSAITNRVTELRAQGRLARATLGSDGRVLVPPPLDAAVTRVAKGAPKEREWSVNEKGASLTAYTFEEVRTLEDLQTICEVDLQQWVPSRLHCNAWGGGTAQEPRTLYQVKADFTPRKPTDPIFAVAAMVEGAMKGRKPVAIRAVRTSKAKRAHVLVIADPHFGKLAWSRGTGGADYDVDIAYRVLMDGAMQLMDEAPACERRFIVSLGDFFHFDTLGGTTTGGTVVDRDSRVPKILEVGSDALARLVRHSAARVDTELLIVPGNHDEVLSAALQRIMVAEFRGSSAVVDDTHTRRKARLYGRNLIGFNHGDKRKKELCNALAIEHAKQWGESTYREIHTGHLHSEGERYEGTLTHAGVTLRTHRSLTPPDQWHSDEVYVGAPRGMSAWTYDVRGGLVGMQMYSPDLERAA